MERRALSSLLALSLVGGACTKTSPPAPAKAPETATEMVAQSAPADPAPPEGLRLPRTTLPTHYDLEMALHAKEGTFDGRVAIDLAVTAPTRVVWLHAHNLKTHEAYFESAGQKRSARVINDAKNERVGFLTDEMLPAGTARLFVRYAGEMSQNSDRGLFREEEGGQTYVFTQFENTDARSAVPCFDEPNLKTPWDVTLDVPATDVAIGNTRTLSEEAIGSGRKRVRFATTKPLPSYLVAFAAGPFDLVDGGLAGKGKIPVRIAAPKGAGKEAAYAAKITADLVGVLEDYFGVPYPYDKLDAVSIPTTITFAAMENAGLITFFREGILAKSGEESEAFRRRYADIMAHEIAHQWFGDLVTMAWWDDIWLNEGFATWMTNKVIAKYKPAWAVDVSRVRDDGKAMMGDSLVNARRIRQPIESPDDIANAFDAITYEKGSAVLGMFEAWVGEDKFQKGIHDYLAEHAHGNATSRDFFAAISRHAGRDVAPAFSSFLDQPGVPLLTTTVECTKEGTNLRLAQERYLPLGTKGDTGQHWVIPFCVRSVASANGSAPRADAHSSDADKNCGLLEQTKGDWALGKTTCNAPLVRNAGAHGYYITAYTPATLDEVLRDGTKKLSPAERVALLRDVRALLAAGKLTATDVMSRAAAVAKDPDPSVQRALLTWFDDFAPGVVEKEIEPHFARFVRQTFGARAKQLGFEPRPSDTPETRFLRPLLIEFVANRGEEPALVREAKARAESWLRGGTMTTSDEIVDAVLSIASAHGDRAWFDELHRSAKDSTDVKRRRRLIDAMASFRDPAIVEASIGLALGSEFDVREALGFWRQDPAMAKTTFQVLARNYEDIKARLPSEVLGNLPGRVQGLCSDGDRDAVEAFFKERSLRELGGPRNLAQTLEHISICSAFRARQAPSLAAYLTNGTSARSASVAPSSGPASASGASTGPAGTAPAPRATGRP